MYDGYFKKDIIYNIEKMFCPRVRIICSQQCEIKSIDSSF